AIRCAAMQYGVPCINTMTGAKAAIEAIGALKAGPFAVTSLQEYHAQAARKRAAAHHASQPTAFDWLQHGNRQAIERGDRIPELTGGSSLEQFSRNGRVTVAEALAQLPGRNGQSFASV